MKGLYAIKLILVFLLVFVISWDRQETTSEVESRAVDAISFQDEQDSIIMLDECDFTFEELTSLNRWRRNPFLPFYNLSAAGLENQQFSQTYTPQLNRIYREDGIYRAIVNNTVIQEGDAYLDMTVSYIGESILVFTQANNQQLVLELIPEGN